MPKVVNRVVHIPKENEKNQLIDEIIKIRQIINEVADRNGGLTIFTSTDQAGNFKIGDGVIINQQTGTVSGDSYTRSLFSTLTPFILALGGD